MQTTTYRKRAALAAALSFLTAGTFATPAHATTAPAASFRPGGRNVAAAEAGASIVAFSSQFNTTTSAVVNMIDQVTGTYWATGSGQLTNQFAIVSLAGGVSHRIDRFHVQPNEGASTTQRVRDFAIDVSTTTADPAAFTTVLTATAADSSSVQEFVLPAPVDARYVRYRPLNNRGSTCCIGTAALRVLTGVESTGRNVALLEAGAAGAGQSSQASTGTTPNHMIDNDYNNSYWQTANLQVANQWAKVALDGGTHLVDRFRIRGHTTTAAYRPKDIQVAVSTLTTADADFTTVVTATMANNALLQEFVLPAPVLARYVKFTALNNYGNPNYIITSQLQVISPVHDKATVSFFDTSTDAENDIVSWLWDFGDTTSSTDQHPTHTFPAPGDYTVSLTVTDALGNVSTTSQVQRVFGPPTASFTYTPPTPNEGQNVVFTPTTADPDGGAILSRVWTWGDGGSTAQTPGTATIGHAYGDNLTYTVTLTIVDDQGQTAVATNTVSPANLPPVINTAFPNRLWVAGQTLSFGVSVSDPGFSDTRSCTWEWGDGTPDGTSCSLFSHTYASPALGEPAAVLQPTLTVIDDDGASASRSFQLTVFPQVFVPAASGLLNPTGLAYSTLTNSLIVTARGTCENRVAALYPDGTVRYASGDVALTCGETPLAVSPGQGGFGLGDTFLGNGQAGKLVRVRMDAEASSLGVDQPWASVPSTGLLRGIVFDTGGAFGNELLTVWTDGRVFRTAADGTSTQVAAGLGANVEGADIAPATFGPAAGCLLLTDRILKTVRRVCADGSVATLVTVSGAGGELEGVNTITSAGTYYSTEYQYGRIYAADSQTFTADLAGTVLVSTQSTGDLWSLSYDPVAGAFTASLFSVAMHDNVYARVEQAVFVPALAGARSALSPVDATVAIGDPHTVGATVTDSAGNPVGGLDLTFTVAGANTASEVVTTDASGTATFTYTGANAGADTIVASAGSVGTNPATVTWVLRGTRMAAEPAIVHARVPGDTTAFAPNLRARLTDAATGAGVAGRTVTFTALDANGVETAICVATTDGDGTAICQDATAEAGAVVGRSYVATFAGDGTYAGSSDDAPLVRLDADV